MNILINLRKQQSFSKNNNYVCGKFPFDFLKTVACVTARALRQNHNSSSDQSDAVLAVTLSAHHHSALITRLL